MFIYLWTNRINGTGYVGKWHGNVRSLMNRYKRTIRESKSRQYIIYAMKKYGIGSFDLTLLQYCMTPERLKIREKYWIKRLRTLVPNGYNMTKGGDGGPIGSLSFWNGKHRSQETKNKLSIYFKGRKRGPRPEKEKKKAAKSLKKRWKEPLFRKKMTGKNAFWHSKISPMKNKKNKGVSKALKKRWEDQRFRRKMHLIHTRRWRQYRRLHGKAPTRR